MKKCIVLFAVSILCLPSLVFSDSISVRLGWLLPRASTDILAHPDSLWAIEFDQMNFDMKDFNHSLIGFGYERFLTSQFSLTINLDTYSREKIGFYNDYVGYTFDEGDFAFPFEYYDGDFEVVHTYRVSIIPLQMSLKFAPLGRRNRFIPYVGGGGGIYFWRVGIRGEMVDFADTTWVYEDPELGDVQIYPIVVVDARERNRISFGYHAFGGVEFPLGNRATIQAEARYNIVKGTFKDDSAFTGFEDFDMNSLVFTIGFNYWF